MDSAELDRHLPWKIVVALLGVGLHQIVCAMVWLQRRPLSEVAQEEYLLTHAYRLLFRWPSPALLLPFTYHRKIREY